MIHALIREWLVAHRFQWGGNEEGEKFFAPTARASYYYACWCHKSTDLSNFNGCKFLQNGTPT